MAVAAVALAAGCAGSIAGTPVAGPTPVVAPTSDSPTTSSSPTPTPTPSSTPKPTTTSPHPGTSTPPGDSNLGTALYPTNPRQIPARPADKTEAALLEAGRLADTLVVPTLFAPTFTRNSVLSTLRMKSAQSLSTLFLDPVPQVAERAGMITGFSSARTDPSGTAIVVAVLEFADAPAAAKAATQLTAASADKKYDTGKAAVPGQPKATGQAGKFTDGTAYISAFLPQGFLVQYVYVSGKVDAAKLPPLAGAALKAETAAFASFKQIPPNQLANQPTDPDGLIARTLPQPQGQGTVNDGVYTVGGFLHFSTDPVGDRKLLTAAGVDRISRSRDTVYRAKDAAGATAIRDDFYGWTMKNVSGMTAYPAPAGVATAKCLQNALGAQYYCAFTVGRYAVEYQSSSEQDLRDSLLAQQALLGG